VTTALGSSRLWATIGHGIVNEVYWPSTGQPQIRDLGFYLVGNGRWIDLKRERRYRLLTPGPGLPALTIVHHGDDYQLTLELLPDPLRDVLNLPSTKCPFALHPNLSGEVPRNISSVAKPLSKERASALDVGLIACRSHGCEEL
jgi:hypothetical protein